MSHETALWLWGVGERLGKGVDVTMVDRRNPGSPEGVRVHRRRVGLLDSVGWRDGIPVTSVIDSLVDATSVVGPDELEAACALAVRNRLTTLKKLAEGVERAPARSGIGTLRALVAGQSSLQVSRSANERAALRLIHAAELPRPEANVVVLGKELDLYWREARLGVELDAFSTHGGPRAFEDDRKVDADLEAADIKVLRFTGRRIRTAPLAVIARLAAVLTLRLGGLPPPRRR